MVVQPRKLRLQSKKNKKRLEQMAAVCYQVPRRLKKKLGSLSALRPVRTEMDGEPPSATRTNYNRKYYNG